MATSKGQERFFRRSAMVEISLQQFLHRFRRVLRLEVVKNLLAKFGMRPETAAGEKMITFSGFITSADRHLGGDQADVADIVLRAGMVAAGEMDVERRVDFHPRFAPVGNLASMPLG